MAKRTHLPQQQGGGKQRVGKLRATVVVNLCCCAQVRARLCHAGAGVVRVPGRVQGLAALHPQQARLSQILWRQGTAGCPGLAGASGRSVSCAYA